MNMKRLLMILGKESSELAKGEYNKGLFDSGLAMLKKKFDVITSEIDKGYDVKDEIEKFKAADAVIFQYPVYWFMMPSSLKKYMDEVYTLGEFFGFGENGYGSGGLMKNKKFMLSTTWNAPLAAFNDNGAFFGNLTPEGVLLPMRKSNLFCGMEELPHFSCHDVIHNPKFEQDKVRYLDHLQKVFG
jgi:modulator of drug activity B